MEERSTGSTHSPLAYLGGSERVALQLLCSSCVLARTAARSPMPGLQRRPSRQEGGEGCGSDGIQWEVGGEQDSEMSEAGRGRRGVLRHAGEEIRREVKLSWRGRCSEGRMGRCASESSGGVCCTATQQRARAAEMRRETPRRGDDAELCV